MKAVRPVCCLTGVLIAFAFIVTSYTAVFSQDAAGTASSKWVRVETADKEVSVAMPSGFIVDAEKRDRDQRLKIFAFENGVLMEFSIRRPDEPLDNLRGLNSGEGETTAFVKGRINGRRNSSEEYKDYFFEHISLASGKSLYQLSVVSRVKTNNAIARFLHSIKINGKPLFVIEKKIDEPADSVSIESLKTSLEVGEAFARKIEKGGPEPAVSSEPADKDRYDYGKFSRPPLILSKGSPAWRHPPLDFSRASFSRYPAILRVQLLANGQIGKVISHSGIDDTYVKACIEAARKIRFIPAQIDGKNVDSTEIVDYSTTVTMIPTIFSR